MPPPTQFYSYNVITDEQRERLRAIRQPLHTFALDNPTLFDTWALNQNVNNISVHPHITQRHNIDGTVIEVNAPAAPARPRRRRPTSVSSDDPDFVNAPPRRYRRRDAQELPIEKQRRFILKRNSFKNRWNKEFPDKPCAECGILLLPRHRKIRSFVEDHVYGITRVFGIPVHGPLIILCNICIDEPRPPINVGAQPECIASLPLRSAKFLSPFQLDSNLGRTSGYNLAATPFNYRTLSGKIIWRTQNPRAIALYSGVLGAWLESSRHNRYDRDHNILLLERCRDWLLQNNVVFQRNDVRANIQVPDPLPLIQLISDHREERRPANRPDFVMDPLQHDAETRNEDFRYNRLTVGRVTGSHRAGNLPDLYRSDPDVEVLLFPHLYPYGKGQWVEGPRGTNGRRDYTQYMDVKMKLNSINPVFRNDWYWPAWAYQEMEARRILQNNARIVNNRTRQAIDGRLPQNQLLQQSAYGTFSIINEAITSVIPASIRSGEAYFHEKEAMVNAMKQSTGLPKLFVTLTFNDR